KEHQYQQYESEGIAEGRVAHCNESSFTQPEDKASQHCARNAPDTSKYGGYEAFQSGKCTAEGKHSHPVRKVQNRTDSCKQGTYCEGYADDLIYPDTHKLCCFKVLGYCTHSHSGFAVVDE